jgi:hypothetical protein
VLAPASEVANEPLILRQRPAPVGRPHQLMGFVEEQKDGRRVPTQQPKTYELLYCGGSEPTLSVRRPFAYMIPASCTSVAKILQQHGIRLEELREAIELGVEVYRIDKIERGSEFQSHRPVSLRATSRAESRRVASGTLLVRTAQPLGSLAAYLLEPQAEDGLVTWNFFDAFMEEGKDFPVVRVSAKVELPVVPVRSSSD